MKITHYIDKIKSMDLDSYKTFVNDVYTHKILVLECSQYMATYLIENGSEEEVDASFLLLKSVLYHDNSKLDLEELEGFLTISNDLSCLGNADRKLNRRKLKVIKLHWLHSKHHPEHYIDAEKMPLYSMLEMVCDHAARSIQFKTPLIPFIEARQENRFHFKQETFNKLMKYYRIIDTYIEDKYNIIPKEN